MFLNVSTAWTNRALGVERAWDSPSRAILLKRIRGRFGWIVWKGGAARFSSPSPKPEFTYLSCICLSALKCVLANLCYSMNVDVFLIVSGIVTLVLFIFDARHKRRDFLLHWRDVAH